MWKKIPRPRYSDITRRDYISDYVKVKNIVENKNEHFEMNYLEHL